MIISASYKTDIPTFYGEWFRNRLRAGYCKMVNPYSRHQSYTISLKRQDVNGFVFWTKNVGPFIAVLDDVHADGFPFVVQHTINAYPRALESRVVDADRAVDNVCALAKRYGPRALVWRYDTIILSTLTDADFHRRNFERLARRLSGATDEVVVSFLQLYKKTKRNLDLAARENGFEWYEPSAETKRQLLADLVGIAAQNKMTLAICTQPDLLIGGVKEARCIDADRLMDIGGYRFRARLGGMRQGCGCFASKDIGDYDTCPHGCVYCYAVINRDLALKRHEAHDPNGEYLFSAGGTESKPVPPDQLPLFNR